MLKQHPRTFEAAQVTRDGAGLLGAFFLAVYAGSTPFSPNSSAEVTPSGETVLVGLLALTCWLLVAHVGGLYTSYRSRGLSTELFHTFRTSVIALFLVVTLTYFVRDTHYSRPVLLSWMPLSFVFVAGLRAISRVGLWQLRSSGYNLRHVMVVGAGPLAHDVVNRLHLRRGLGLRVLGVVAEGAWGEHDASRPEGSISGAPLLGGRATLLDWVERGAVDQVIVALPIGKLGHVAELMEELGAHPVEVKLVPDVMQYATLCGSIEELAGLPAVNLQGHPLGQAERGMKRCFDVALASALLLAGSPVLLLIALTVKISSLGPVLHRQVRVGLDGRRFTMIKFRSMVADAEALGPALTCDEDPRCTGVGRWLRRYSLDELPQLWNVLLGDMSLVGPRPEQPAFASELAEKIPRYALRHRVKAGMTGWAQVNGLRGNSSMTQRVEHDLYYIENWSIFLDLKILVRTLLGGFLSPNAY